MKSHKEMFIEILKDAYNKEYDPDITLKQVLHELEQQLKEIVTVREKV